MNKKQSGFTLIELMLSAAVMGFVISSVALMIFYGFRQFRMQSQRMEMSSQSRSAVEIMTQQIRMAKASSVRIKSVMVTGSEVKFAQIVFEDYGNEWWHSFYLDQPGNLKPGRLMYEYETVYGGNPLIVKKVLATGVSSIIFSYPNSQNSRKIEINLGIARPVYENRIITGQIRQIVTVRNP